MDNSFYIYCLFRPWNLEPCYIGKGSGNRSDVHAWYGEKHYNPHLANIYRRAGATEVPCVILHEGLDEQTAFSYERAFIQALGRADQGKGPLCNHTDGGEGCKGLSEETVEKIRQSALGRTHSAETREKISRIGKGSKRSLEARENISQGRKKWLQSNKHPTLGRKHTDDARAKIGATHKGKTVSTETRQRQSLAKRNISAETRQKMSASAKLRCERRKASLGI